MNLPEEVAVMTLTDTVLLPKTIVPLRIFEDRYRQMLADSLEGDRIFAIANQIEDILNPFEDWILKLHKVATVGLIRMSAQNADGSSMLVLEGTERVLVESVTQERPYPKIKISPLPTTNQPGEELEAELVVELLDKVDTLNSLSGNQKNEVADVCHTIDELETLAHFIMQSYCTSAPIMQKTLETTDLIQRCKIISDFLDLQITLVEDTED